MDLSKYVLASLVIIASAGLSEFVSAQTLQSCAETVAEERQVVERHLVEKLQRLADARLDAEAIEPMPAKPTAIRRKTSGTAEASVCDGTTCQ